MSKNSYAVVSEGNQIKVSPSQRGSISDLNDAKDAAQDGLNQLNALIASTEAGLEDTISDTETRLAAAASESESNLNQLAIDTTAAEALVATAEARANSAASSAGEAVNAKASTITARDQTLAAIALSSAQQSKLTYAEAIAVLPNMAVGDVVHIAMDEGPSGNLRYTARSKINSTDLSAPVFLFAQPVVTTTAAEGFIHGSSAPADRAINDAAWAALKLKYADAPLSLGFSAGQIHTDAGLQWEDRTFPLDYFAIGVDAGTTCHGDSVIPLRARGFLDGQGARLNGWTVRGLKVRGNWDGTQAGKGNQPYAGIAGEAFWVWASTIEGLYVNGFHVSNCDVADSQYDLVSIPMAVNGWSVKNCKLSRSADDGINPGGFISAEIDNDALNVRGGEVTNNEISYVYNVGIHCSGGSKGIWGRFNKIDRCGLAPVDFVHKDIDVVFRGSNIGQCDSNDPAISGYPAGSNGFQRSHGAGGTACRGILRKGVDGQTQTNVHIKGHITNMFDNQGDNMRALEMSWNGPIENSSFDLVVDNTGLPLDGSGNKIYDGTDFVAIQSGDANNSNFENVHMKMKAFLPDYENGGRADVHHGGESNSVDIEIHNGGGAQIDGEGLRVENLLMLNSSAQTIISKQASVGKARFTNDNHSATAFATKLSLNGPDITFDEEVELQDCGLTYGSSGVRPIFKKGIRYSGASTQRPSFITGNLGGEGAQYNSIHIEQEALAAGVSSGTLFTNRKGGVRIKSFTGYSDADINVYTQDNANATETSIQGIDFRSAGRFIFEVFAASSTRYSGHLESSYAADSEVITRSLRSVVDLTIVRTASSSHRAVEVYGDSSIIRGVGSGFNSGVVFAFASSSTSNIELTSPKA